jgi:hypothetical protein
MNVTNISNEIQRTSPNALEKELDLIIFEIGSACCLDSSSASTLL